MVPIIGWTTSWWIGVVAGVLYTIAATIVLRPVVRRAREARERAKRALLAPKDWQGRELDENSRDDHPRTL